MAITNWSQLFHRTEPEVDIQNYLDSSDIVVDEATFDEIAAKYRDAIIDALAPYGMTLCGNEILGEKMPEVLDDDYHMRHAIESIDLSSILIDYI